MAVCRTFWTPLDAATNLISATRTVPYGMPLVETSSTTVRWRILALLMAYAGLCHFNRISISVAGNEHIMREFAIDETWMGLVYSSYLFVYTLCMMPGGWLIDRVGPKRALMLLGFGSAVLVPLTGAASVAAAGSILAVLCIIRGLLGLFSAPLHPAAARTVSFWMPSQARGAANGLVTGTAVAGIASTYFVFGFLMDRVGWPSAFLVAGVVTLLLTLTWSAYATDRPSQHPAVNAVERQLMADDASQPVESQSLEHLSADGEGGLWPTLRNRSLILLTLSYATVGYFQYLFFYWMQYYFDRVLKLGQDDGRLYATIPTLAMAVGMVCGGWLSDRAESQFGRRRGRAITPVCGMIASAVLLGIGITVGHPVAVVTCFALSLGAIGVSESAFWVTGVELGRKSGGLSAAILNTGGNVGGILAPVVTPLFSHYFGWQAGLGLASMFSIFGAVVWRWIDPAEQSARGRDT